MSKEEKRQFIEELSSWYQFFQWRHCPDKKGDHHINSRKLHKHVKSTKELLDKYGGPLHLTTDEDGKMIWSSKFRAKPCAPPWNTATFPNRKF